MSSLFSWIGAVRTPPRWHSLTRFWIGYSAIFTITTHGGSLVRELGGGWWYLPLLMTSLGTISLIQRLVGEFNFGVNAYELSSLGSKAYFVRLFCVAVLNSGVGGLIPSFAALFFAPVVVLAFAFGFEKTLGKKILPKSVESTEGNFPFGVNK